MNACSTNAGDGMTEAIRDFTVKGQRKDINTIFLKLRIEDSTGHVRNIHFPFDVEADTAISVASEMVAELDLTDQDVTTVAAMIDSEIQAHFPEWIPGDAYEDGDQVSVSDKCNSETKDEPIELDTDSDYPSGGFVLERFPSGRKYWSDSPREAIGDSPLRPSVSAFSSEVEMHVNIDPSSEGYEAAGSPNDLHVDEGDYEVASPTPEEHSTFLPDSSENSTPLSCPEAQKSCSSDHNEVVSPSPNQDSTFLPDSKWDNAEALAGKGAYSFDEICKRLMEHESDDVKSIGKKLETLLMEQQKELDELKKKHELTIKELLKDLPPEICSKMRTPDYDAQHMVHYLGHSSDFCSSLPPEALPLRTCNLPIDRADDIPYPKRVAASGGSSNFLRFVGRVWKKNETPGEKHVACSNLTDRSNLLKCDVKSADGIAVILGDNLVTSKDEDTH